MQTKQVRVVFTLTVDVNTNPEKWLAELIRDNILEDEERVSDFEFHDVDAVEQCKDAGLKPYEK